LPRQKNIVTLHVFNKIRKKNKKIKHIDMLTLKFITEHKEQVIKGLQKKHFPNAEEAIENVLAVDRRRREAQQKLDATKQQAKQMAAQIGTLMKQQ
jgi:seryl-tRNA synthetase